jgi:hypothetical protein
LTETEIRFRRWAEKINVALEEDKVNELTDGCRWLSYWLRKARDQDLRLYAKLEGEAKPLFENSALRLLKHANSKLDKASKRREGSKARLRELTGFAYHYGHYIHPLLRESGRDSLAVETLQSFNSSYMGEIVGWGEALEGSWPAFMIRLLECYEEMGIPLGIGYKEYFSSVLRGGVEPPELSPYHRVLDEAERCKHQPMACGLLVCSAVRMWVRDLCVNYDAESSRSFLGPRGGFRSWSFSEMMGYLKSVGRASVDEVFLFCAMNRDLFELVGKEGYQEPFVDELEDDISEARYFIRFREGEFSFSGGDNDKVNENDDNEN